jgi:hypothetical protein
MLLGLVEAPFRRLSRRGSTSQLAADGSWASIWKDFDCLLARRRGAWRQGPFRRERPRPMRPVRDDAPLEPLEVARAARPGCGALVGATPPHQLEDRPDRIRGDMGESNRPPVSVYTQGGRGTAPGAR